MPTNYKTVNGDTANKIAGKFYGDQSKGYLIIGANQNLRWVDLPVTGSQTIIAGIDIIIPDQVDPTPADTPEQKKVVSLFNRTPINISVSADDEDEVTLTVKGQAFRVFDNLAIKFDYDKIANEFNLNAPFEPDVPEYRAAFKPIYQASAIYIGGKLVLTGESTAEPDYSTDRSAVDVKGTSITGTLLRTAMFAPFEFAEGATYTDIITDVCARYGLAVVIDARAREVADKPFGKRVEFSPTEPAGGKLTSLARERGLILSPTFNGRVLVTKPITEAATVQAFVSGQAPAKLFSANYDADALHTSYIGYAPDTPDEATEADKTTLPGYPQPGILPRMKAIVPSDVDNQNIGDALRAERGRGYAKWITGTLPVLGWRDINGDLYQPNTLVTIISPRAFIYDTATFFIRSVTLKKLNNKKTSLLEVILPEAFSGQEVKIKV